MHKNDAGLTILERGDIVQIGSGKVRYTVLADEVESTGSVMHIESHNTGKTQTIARDRLTLVQSVQDVAYEAGADVKELNITEESETLDNSTWALSEEDTKPVKETSAYAKAVLFALNALQKHVYAGTVSEKTKGKRRSLGRRQKASRKANR